MCFTSHLIINHSTFHSSISSSDNPHPEHIPFTLSYQPSLWTYSIYPLLLTLTLNIFPFALSYKPSPWTYSIYPLLLTLTLNLFCSPSCYIHYVLLHLIYQLPLVFLSYTSFYFVFYLLATLFLSPLPPASSPITHHVTPLILTSILY
jgi:hypothetical protein